MPVAMASSECIDVRREALQSLARASRADGGRQAVGANAEALGVLRRSLLAADTDAVRCATAVIAELARTERGRSALLRANLIEPVVSLLQSPVCHIARQAATTLARVSQTHGCRVHLSERHARMLQRCGREAEDARVRSLVSGAVERLAQFQSLAFAPSRTLFYEGHAPLSV